MFPDRSTFGKTMIFCAAGLTLLVLAARINFLMFHTFAEFFSIVIVFGIFIVSWHSRHLHANGFFTFLGIASLVRFSLRRMVERSLTLVEGNFRQHGISVAVNAPEDVSAVGFPNQFAQVVLNILNNSRDALVERRIVNPAVHIELSQEEKRSVVTIRDNAGGIPEEIIDRIFETYFTTKGDVKGTGIGLSMSKTIMERNMAGTIAVRNGREGAEFRLEL